MGFLVILAGSALYNEVIRLCLPENAVEDEASLQVCSESPLATKKALDLVHSFFPALCCQIAASTGEPAGSYGIGEAGCSQTRTHKGQARSASWGLNMVQKRLFAWQNFLPFQGQET